MKIPAFLTTPGTPVARAIEAVTALCLAYVLLGTGFAICCLPPTTNALANANSKVAYSPYDKEELVNLAEATRAYTVEGMDYASYCAIEAQALAALPDALTQRLAKAASAEGFSDGTIEGFRADALTQPVEAAETSARLNDGLALSAESVSHLDDVHAVVLPALAGIAIMLVAFIACVGHVAFRFGRKSAGTCLVAGAILVLAFFAVCFIWALTDFNAIFSWMHSLFFADGTWTFGTKSLLICMYPEGFWVGMGATWLIATCIACVVALATGLRLRKN